MTAPATARVWLRVVGMTETHVAFRSIQTTCPGPAWVARTTLPGSQGRWLTLDDYVVGVVHTEARDAHELAPTDIDPYGPLPLAVLSPVVQAAETPMDGALLAAQRVLDDTVAHLLAQAYVAHARSPEAAQELIFAAKMLHAGVWPLRVPAAPAGADYATWRAEVQRRYGF